MPATRDEEDGGARHPDAALFDRAAVRERKRHAVLRGAAAAFTRNGFHNTSMDDLAAGLGISKPTLYSYFRNKQQLLYECHQLAMDHGEAALALAANDGKTGLDRLKIFCRRYMLGILDDFGSCAVLTDVDSLPPQDREAVIGRRARISGALRELIRQGAEDGSLAVTDPNLASLFVLGVVNWIPVWYRPHGPSTREAIVVEFLRLFESGLGGKPRRNSERRRK